MSLKLKTKHKKHAKRMIIHSVPQFAINGPLITLNILPLSNNASDIQFAGLFVMILVTTELIGRKRSWFK